MTEGALHQLIIETMSAIRADVHNVRTEVQSLRSEIGKVRSEINEVRVDGSERGRRLWEQTNSHGELLIRLDERTKKVEDQVADSKPTISDYLTWKSRADAAGWLGKRLWIIGGSLTGVAIWIYSSWDKITHWLRIMLGIRV